MWEMRSRRKASSHPARLTFDAWSPIWVRPNDVDCESSQDREALGTVVFSGSTAILVEHNVEDPMQLVLDSPMTAHDLQQSFGGDVLGKQVVAHRWLVGALAVRASARGDAGQGDDAGKTVCRTHQGVGNDGAAPGFVSVVRWARDVNSVSFNNSSRNGPLKLSMKAFCMGLPGAM